MDLERLATVRQKRGRRTSERERVRGGGVKRENHKEDNYLMGLYFFTMVYRVL